ncbi:MAG: hypothetical protein IJ193_03200 [Bacilli bacterium]|nr:hypothetical protein [Bacilli bacterium]
MKKYINIIAIVLWFTLLKNTDAYYLPYVVIGLLGSFSYFLKEEKEIGNLEKVFTILYSGMIYFANYSLFWNNHLTNPSVVLNLLFGIGKSILFWYSAYLIISNLLVFLFQLLENKKEKKIKVETNTNSRVFSHSLILLTILDLFFLIFAKYPGNISPDSINQIEQIKSGIFTNHHPYFHTILIEFFMHITRNINTGLFIYNVFQMIYLNACISYAVTSLYELKVSDKVRKWVFFWYLCMPFNILFSFTIWKDIIFAGSLLLLVTTLYKILKQKEKLTDYFLFAYSALLVCIFRNNGLIAFTLGTILFIILYKKQFLKVTITSIGIILLSFLLTHPLLNVLGIEKGNVVESLSVPINQISRVIVDSNLTESEDKLLSEIVDTSRVKEEYLPYISDPVKNLIREKDNITYFENHKKAYLKLYLKLMIKHPIEYINAYIDLTKGYYNSGYQYWVWYGNVYENNFGIERSEKLHIVSLGLSAYCFLFENISILQVFLSIGLYTWIGLFLLFYNLKKKRKEELTLLFIPFAVLVTLLIATPVYSEFRYAYPYILTLPFILAVSFHKTKEKA